MGGATKSAELVYSTGRQRALLLRLPVTIPSPQYNNNNNCSLSLLLFVGGYNLFKPHDK